jgi:hypothetical protein
MPPKPSKFLHVLTEEIISLPILLLRHVNSTTLRQKSLSSTHRKPRTKNSIYNVSDLSQDVLQNAYLHFRFSSAQVEKTFLTSHATVIVKSKSIRGQPTANLIRLFIWLHHFRCVTSLDVQSHLSAIIPMMTNGWNFKTVNDTTKLSINYNYKS